MERFSAVVGQGVQKRNRLHHHMRIGVAHAAHHRLQAILGQAGIGRYLVAHIQNQRPVVVGISFAGGLFYKTRKA